MSEIKMRGGKWMISVDMEIRDERIIFKFDFNLYLKDRIKAMAGARWNPETKEWSCVNNSRNLFQISYLMGNNVYAVYDQPLKEVIPPSRACYKCKYGKPKENCRLCHGSGVIKPFDHQIDMFQHIITRRQCIVAGQIGVGKTLAAINAMDWALENEGVHDWIYVGPRSALAAVKLEWLRWRPKVEPRFVTYEGLKKIVESSVGTPQGIVFDESPRIKTATAQRSQAARLITDDIRAKYKDLYYIILMTGTPAPKSPLDWYNQVETCRPGYLVEGTPDKFKYNMGLIKNEESPIGGSFPKLITWWDDNKKCRECGQFENALIHNITSGTHIYAPSINEVARLYRRMKGLTMVKLKSQCLDLPEMRYEIIRVEPSQSILNAAELITAKSSRAIQAMTFMRELSDGFQYQLDEEGTRECMLCYGSGEVSASIAPTCTEKLCPYCDSYLEEGIAMCRNCDNYVGDQTTFDINNNEEISVEDSMVRCPNCKGTGKVPRMIRKTFEVESPKDQVIIDALDEHEDVGRIVLYAGFTGSIDKLVKLCKKEKWTTIRVDGRGWDSEISRCDVEMISAFQDSDQERIAFIAHPKSGGMGLTLTASPTTYFYSNGFNGEDREQAEGRIHRPGMDVNRGATIRDIFHLPIDEYILQNLKKKRRLQNISMGMLNEEIKTMERIDD